MTPQQIIAMMKSGNERFRRGERMDRNFLAEQEGSAAEQYPAAILLTCIDSRAPAEIILDLGIGEVFNARLAGNVADQMALASMEFACKIAGAKVILVMGHTGCGAVKGAIDRVRLGKLTSLLERIGPAIESTPCVGERSSTNAAFVDAVARANVQLTMKQIRRESAVLDELVGDGKVVIAGAMYDLRTATVDFLA